MKIASINKKNRQNFKGNFLNSKKLLKVLKFASDKGALVTSGATVAFSAVLRPAITMLTPDTPERDKKYSAAKSIASAAAVFLTTGLLSGRVNKGLERISKYTDKYLSKKSMENLKDGAKKLELSAKYRALEQTIKLSPEMLTVVPKLFLTSALITPVADYIIKKDKNSAPVKTEENKTQSFKGLKGNSGKKAAKIIAKIMNNEKVQDFVGKIKNKKFIENSIYIKDVIATGVFSGFVKINKTIDQKDKANLIANTVVSTALSIAGAMSFDKVFEKPLAKLSEQFKMANKNDANLEKYLNGARILKSALILGTIYYGIIPIISTYAGSKISNKQYANKQN